MASKDEVVPRPDQPKPARAPGAEPGVDAELSARLQRLNGTANGSPAAAQPTDVDLSAAVTESARKAVLSTLGVLKETELDENLEEIKKLDTQLDHFNSYLDKVEERNNQLNVKLKSLLEEQKQARLQRRASFQMRKKENDQEDTAFHSSVQSLLSRCQQARRVSSPDIPIEVQAMLAAENKSQGGVPGAH